MRLPNKMSQLERLSDYLENQLAPHTLLAVLGDYHGADLHFPCHIYDTIEPCNDMNEIYTFLGRHRHSAYLVVYKKNISGNTIIQFYNCKFSGFSCEKKPMYEFMQYFMVEGRVTKCIEYDMNVALDGALRITYLKEGFKITLNNLDKWIDGDIAHWLSIKEKYPSISEGPLHPAKVNEKEDITIIDQVISIPDHEIATADQDLKFRRLVVNLDKFILKLNLPLDDIFNSVPIIRAIKAYKKLETDSTELKLSEYKSWSKDLNNPIVGCMTNDDFRIDFLLLKISEDKYKGFIGTRQNDGYHCDGVGNVREMKEGNHLHNFINSIVEKKKMKIELYDDIVEQGETSGNNMIILGKMTGCSMYKINDVFHKDVSYENVKGYIDMTMDNLRACY
jgi:hypothetical protein